MLVTAGHLGGGEGAQPRCPSPPTTLQGRAVSPSSGSAGTAMSAAPSTQHLHRALPSGPGTIQPDSGALDRLRDTPELLSMIRAVLGHRPHRQGPGFLRVLDSLNTSVEVQTDHSRQHD